MKSNIKLIKIFNLIVSIQTILMGLFFIIQILRIYYGNEATFTREICKQYLLQILPVFIIWCGLIIISFVYFKNIKTNENVKTTSITKLYNLEKICSIDNENMKDEYLFLTQEKNKRKKALLICFIITIICIIMGLLYLINPKHFISTGDLTAQAIAMATHLLPWCIISFASFIIYVFYQEKSAKKSIDIIKQIIKNNGKKQTNYIKDYTRKINIARSVIIFIALILIIVGIIDGSVNSVLLKAINICTECIGLG